MLCGLRGLRVDRHSAVRGPRWFLTLRMIRPILKYGDSILHDPARPVETITPDIARIIDDMIETMYAAPGVGLAAPQIGVPLRIFVVDISVPRPVWLARLREPGDPRTTAHSRKGCRFRDSRPPSSGRRGWC